MPRPDVILTLALSCTALLGAQETKKIAPPPGFEPLPLPGALLPELAIPSFGASRHASVPLLLALRSANGETPMLATAHWLGDEGWRSVELAELPASPADTAPFALGLVPWEGTPRDWGYYLWREDLSPLVLQKTRMLSPLPLGVRLRRQPLAVDLDRDLEASVILLPRLGAQQGVAALPRVVTAPGRSFEEIELSRETWLTQLRGATRVVPWDFDEDQLEDLLVLRGKGRSARLLANLGDQQLELAPEDELPRDASNAPLEAFDLRLGPEREGRQWFVSWLDEGQEPRLGVRIPEEDRFSVHGPSASQLEGLRAIDARILDLDLDGREELLLLCRPATEAAEPQLLRLQLPSNPALACEPIHPPVPVPGATGIATGDLDGDGAIDLVIQRGRLTPLLLRNLAAETRRRTQARPNWATLRLRGNEDMHHAIGAYVEFLIDDERILRMRWPPIDDRDQLLLTATWPSERSAAPDALAFLITWPDSNSIRYETQPGGFQEATR